MSHLHAIEKAISIIRETTEDQRRGRYNAVQGHEEEIKGFILLAKTVLDAGSTADLITIFEHIFAFGFRCGSKQELEWMSRRERVSLDDVKRMQTLEAVAKAAGTARDFLLSYTADSAFAEMMPGFYRLIHEHGEMLARALTMLGKEP